MTVTVQLPAEASAYLERVRAALAGIPEAEREELLADVETSVREDPRGVEARLGPPERFAAELRSAAGLEPAARSTDARSFAGQVRAAWAAVPRPAWLAQLAPLWWALRGWIVLCWFDDLFGTGPLALTPRFGGALITAAVWLAFVAGSVAVGLSGRIPRWPQIAANAAAGALLLALLAGAQASPASPIVVMTNTEPPSGLLFEGRPVENLYVFDRRGRLVPDARVFDSHGRAVTVGSADDQNRRVVRGRDGEPLLNAFPIRYYDPGTRRVSEPLAGTDVVGTVPRVATPALR